MAEFRNIKYVWFIEPHWIYANDERTARSHRSSFEITLTDRREPEKRRKETETVIEKELRMANIPPASHSMDGKACDVMHIWVMWIIKCHDGRCFGTCENWIEWNGMTVNIIKAATNMSCVWILLLLLQYYVIISTCTHPNNYAFNCGIGQAKYAVYDLSKLYGVVSLCDYMTLGFDTQWKTTIRSSAWKKKKNRLNKREEEAMKRWNYTRRVYTLNQRGGKKKRKTPVVDTYSR